MPEVICNTSPLQYLHQLGKLDLLPRLVQRVTVPEAVVRELEAGRKSGVLLPNVTELSWVTVRRPRSHAALPLITDMGRGEAEVLLLALESTDTVVVLDDRLARRVAEAAGLRVTGTLGLLLDAKRAGIATDVAPMLERLDHLGFRLAPRTRDPVLRLAGESAALRD